MRTLQIKRDAKIDHEYLPQEKPYNPHCSQSDPSERSQPNCAKNSIARQIHARQGTSLTTALAVSAGEENRIVCMMHSFFTNRSSWREVLTASSPVLPSTIHTYRKMLLALALHSTNTPMGHAMLITPTPFFAQTPCHPCPDRPISQP